MEVILSEVHDFSRAVDGLVKEIYLGMIFLQLQVRLELRKTLSNLLSRDAVNK